jgi:hypothetical protein
MTLNVGVYNQDISLHRQAPLEFLVPGHTRAYCIPYFLPYFGASFAIRFRDSWRKAAVFSEPSTSENYFKSVRTAFMIIARRGTADKNSSEASVLMAFRGGAKPNDREWAEVLSNFAGAIVNIGDKSFIDSTNVSSRNKKSESLRVGLRWLAQQGLIPEIEFECRRLEDRLAKPSKCAATVAFDAGRLPISGLTSSAGVQAFVDFNNRCLEEIRHCLWLELKANNELYDLGQELMFDPAVPRIEDAEVFLAGLRRDDVRAGKHLEILGVSDKQALGLALLILRYRAGGGRFKSSMPMEFARSIIDHAAAQPYFEATTKALNAAYHITMIDAEANCQPVDDIPLACFSGRRKRGKQGVRSLPLKKNRKGGERVPGKLKENLEETQLYLDTKSTTERPSGVVVLEIWKKLTQGMRQSDGPTLERLWIWRVAGELRVETRLVSMSSERWPAFLERHTQNEVFGGLPITRPMLRTTARNAKSENRDIDFVVQQAQMGHSAPRTTFEYLSEGAMRALLAAKIREFLDVWEATSLDDIESAAEHLGVPGPDLHRRAQLGLDNGLAFAARISAQPNDLHGENEFSTLSAQARVFRVSKASLIKLELARRALRSQFAAMVNKNPLRLMRTWIPWMAIVEGYCEKLEQTRFRVQFRRAQETVDAKLQAGEMRMPLLW